jgi:hypothetical protein
MSLLDEIGLVKDRWISPLSESGEVARNEIVLANTCGCDSSFTRFDRPAYVRSGRLGQTVCRCG